jgi:hypothetical protein
MKSEYIDFLRKLIIYSLILSFLVVGAVLIFPKKYFTPAMPYLFLFFISVTLISYYILVRASKKTFLKFLNYYMLITVVKLLLFIAVLILYIFLNRNDAVPFALSFFILYLCYTIFEVVRIIAYSKVLQQK